MAGISLIFPHGLSFAGMEIEGLFILDLPPSGSELGINEVAGNLLGILVGSACHSDIRKAVLGLCSLWWAGR